MQKIRFLCVVRESLSSSIYMKQIFRNFIFKFDPINNWVYSLSHFIFDSYKPVLVMEATEEIYYLPTINLNFMQGAPYDAEVPYSA